MDDQEILRVLANEFNIHWETRESPKSRAREFKRRDFHALIDQLRSEKITALIGPRRVGKTTIMFQLIDNLIKEQSVDPKRILYASMDNDYIIKASKEPLEDVINVYMRYILKETPKKLSKKVYIFLDEIQYLKDWQRKMKSWYDYKNDIKFIISGSSSVMIQKNTHHLIGRIHERIIFPMKFVDVIGYREETDTYNLIGKTLRESLKASLISKNPNKLWKTIENMMHDLVKHEHNIEIILQDFIVKGGYPELLEIKEYSQCSAELKDTIFSKSILDILERHGIRDPSTLRYLFSIIASRSGSIVSHSGLSKDLGVERPTISSHLEYLEGAFLISKVPFYSRSASKLARKEKKYYVNDVGMRNSVVGSMNAGLLKQTDELGRVAETLAFDHVKRLKFFLSERQTIDIFYWRDNSGNEIDFILDFGRIPIPIEVKFRNKIDDKTIKTLSGFIKKYKSPFGIVITKNQMEFKDNIIYIPLRIFLIMC